jgi:signal transduction histidine kinase
MRDCVITLDGQNRVLDLNPAAVALFLRLGLFDPGDSFLGTSVLGIVGGWTELAQHLNQGIVEDVDLAVNCDGEQLHYAYSMTELAARRGREIGRLIVLRDITDRKLAEVTLRQQMAQLQTSNEQLDAFAHTAAHDLKGPLSIIVGYVGMLGFYLDELTKDEIRQYLGLLNDTGRQMSGIIDSMLLLAQVHRQDNLVVDLLNMETVVIGALQRVAPMITGSGAEISVPESWPDVVGYGPWLLEVWVNYLLNAIKYGGAPPRITLGHERCEIEPPVSPGGEVDCMPRMRFWIRDNGQGLTEDQMANLFTPFTRFYADTLEGHGLGLSIVYRIIDRLGGQVGVESELGVGSTFWFTLPTVFAPIDVSD